jgi:hypothetical protein
MKIKQLIITVRGENGEAIKGVFSPTGDLISGSPATVTLLRQVFDAAEAAAEAAAPAEPMDTSEEPQTGPVDAEPI